jgi:CRISPR/Cas system CSM-associated protein Csm3 (group 7 of RAMP superfamily)
MNNFYEIDQDLSNNFKKCVVYLKFFQHFSIFKRYIYRSAQKRKVTKWYFIIKDRIIGRDMHGTGNYRLI